VLHLFNTLGGTAVVSTAQEPAAGCGFALKALGHLAPLHLVHLDDLPGRPVAGRGVGPEGAPRGVDRLLEALDVRLVCLPIQMLIL